MEGKKEMEERGNGDGKGRGEKGKGWERPANNILV